ncbi:MAG: mevalonate kinase [Flavobacteriaceae bacterium]|nr:mevalonate kinase [Flavobacteriaceae bacterium]
MKARIFFAKILLFGEYGIIEGAKGLSIPYPEYSGQLQVGGLSNPLRRASNQNIRKFQQYLQKTALSLDWKTLKTDLDQGLAFISSIPQGYGLGSSGALVAALYHQYALDKIPAKPTPNPKEMIALKKAFASMESFFHGQSSGLDPLNSYLQSPLLIQGKDRIETTEIPTAQPWGKGAIFILDTTTKRETAPLVRFFLEKMNDQKFRNNSFHEFTAQTDHSILRLHGGQWGALMQSVKRLSELSLQHFKPMIPKAFHQFWKSGLANDEYYLKLCGSGGGGFLLGFTADWEAMQKNNANYSIQAIHTFNCD